MSELLRLRDLVLSLLEKPRQNKSVLSNYRVGRLAHVFQREIGSSLMADVDIIFPSNVLEGNRFVELVRAEGEHEHHLSVKPP